MVRMRALPAAIAVAASVLGSWAADQKPLPAGTAAPSFSLPTLTGQREALSVYCGQTLSKPYVNNIKQIVVLSYWATYCKPCQKEIPELMQFIRKHQTDSIKVFCISIDKEGASIVAPFVKEKSYDVPVLLDPFGTAAGRYGVKSLPSLFVVDGEGVIRFSASGFDEKQSLVTRLDNIVNSIRQGKPVTDAGGEAGASVAVEEQKPGATAAAPEFSPKDRWHAVARKECGDPPEKIAEEMGITVDQINAWYSDLKKSALSLWGKKKESGE